MIYRCTLIYDILGDCVQKLQGLGIKSMACVEKFIYVITAGMPYYTLYSGSRTRLFRMDPPVRVAAKNSFLFHCRPNIFNNSFGFVYLPPWSF